MVKLLLLLTSINTVASQLCLKRGVGQLGGIKSIPDLPRFASLALSSPWILTSLALQVAGYVMWMMIVTREKLGVAVAFSGACFYILTTFSAWYFYGETPSMLQTAGIALIILGVICLALPMASL